MNKPYKLSYKNSIWTCTFQAMASPCEVLFISSSEKDANLFAEFTFDETKRIESKFSRYLPDNIVHKINSSNGFKIEVDEETSRMLDFANQCYQLSDGLFDISSGLLRNCWTFDGTEQTPDKDKLSTMLKLIGWDKINWEPPHIQLLSGMEIDFGGIGKEYAVDHVADIALSFKISKVMVNFGGDIRTINPDLDSPPWVIGIENPNKENSAIGKISLHNGGIATSGDSKRFCLHHGKRFGHILNPKTGYPIENAPTAVSVVSENCTQAGIIATIAMLHGKDAEQFLESQEITFKCYRD